MSLLLYGWGSNLHGQLRQPFTITKCEQPVYIDNADAIIGATGSQIFISAGQQSLYYGLTIDDDDWTSEPNQHLVAWKAPRSLLGGDELQSIIDKNGHLCVGIEGIPQTNQTWRDAAMDMTGRVVAITGSLFLLTKIWAKPFCIQRMRVLFLANMPSFYMSKNPMTALTLIKWQQAVLISSS